MPADGGRRCHGRNGKNILSVCFAPGSQRAGCGDNPAGAVECYVRCSKRASVWKWDYASRGVVILSVLAKNLVSDRQQDPWSTRFASSRFLRMAGVVTSDV